MQRLFTLSFTYLLCSLSSILNFCGEICYVRMLYVTHLNAIQLNMRLFEMQGYAIEVVVYYIPK